MLQLLTKFLSQKPQVPNTLDPSKTHRKHFLDSAMSPFDSTVRNLLKYVNFIKPIINFNVKKSR